MKNHKSACVRYSVVQVSLFPELERGIGDVAEDDNNGSLCGIDVDLLEYLDSSGAEVRDVCRLWLFEGGVGVLLVLALAPFLIPGFPPGLLELVSPALDIRFPISWR